MAEKDKKEAKGQPNAVVRFYKETAGELRKVSWPTREEAWKLTMIVLVVLVLMAAFLGGIDYIDGLGLDFLLGV